MSHISMTSSLQRVLGSRVASQQAYSVLLRSRAQSAAVVVRNSSSSSSSSPVAPPDIKQLAKMAQIGVTDEEVRLSSLGMRSTYCTGHGATGTHSPRSPAHGSCSTHKVLIAITAGPVQAHVQHCVSRKLHTTRIYWVLGVPMLVCLGCCTLCRSRTGSQRYPALSTGGSQL
jgi:hypothetical protein